MQPRIDYRRHAQGALKAVLDLEKYIAESGLEPKLIHLVKMRASQVNGCAYCLDMHSIDARTEGETGAAAVHAGRMEGDSFFHRTRTRCPRLDRSGHAHCADTRAPRGLRRIEKVFH